MMGQCRVPVAILGEFDSLTGPKALCASEYYAYQDIDGSGSQSLEVFGSYRELLLSPRVASGFLSAEQSGRIKGVVARVLASNESNEESVIVQDPIIGPIASIAFSLPDILARGEKRRFCIVVTHPQNDELFRRWPLLSPMLKILIEDWIGITEQRLSLEYSTFPDLENRREAARKCPLRSLMTLLSKEGEEDHSAFRRVHVFFECALPTVFTFEPSVFLNCKNDCMMRALKDHLEVELQLAEKNVKVVNDDPLRIKGRWISMGNGEIVAIGTPPAVKPLSVWLSEFVQVRSSSIIEIELLLQALLTGNQILIDGENADSSANLALSLSQILPRSLRRVTVSAKEYIMPYESRIVSFSGYLDIKSQCDDVERSNDNPKSVTFLNDGCNPVCWVRVGVDGVIDWVRLFGGDICVLSDEENAPYRTPDGKGFPTIVTRITKFLSLYADESMTLSKYKAFQTQIEQIVSQYVLYGRIYNRLFQRHQMERNTETLGLGGGKDRKYAFFTGLRKSFSCFFGSSLQVLGRRVSSFSVGEHCRISKGGDASFLKSLKGSGLESWMASPSDHCVFLFLGGSPGIL